MLRSSSCNLAVVLGAGLAFGPFLESLAQVSGLPFGLAFAQDDDDGEGDGDDDSGDDDSGDDFGNDGVSPAPAPTQSDRDAKGPQSPRSTAPTPRPVAPAARRPAPAFAPEIVVSDLSATDLDALLAAGFTLIERRQIIALALTVDRLSPPRDLSLPEARARVRALTSGGDADFNHYYRTSAGGCDHENCAAWNMVGWPPLNWQAGPMTTQDVFPGLAPSEATLAASTARCREPVIIGVIDTGINPDHDILQDARLTLIPRDNAPASGAVHGTAVVSLMVGGAGSRVPGLLPGADILAVDVFRREQGEERADAVDLIEGLDILAARQVRLYSLSLSGPKNTVLTRMLDRLTDPAGLDAVVVAAAGNGGHKAAPAWPAAHPAVLAVTAVDRRGRVYADAQRGEHVALSAPGVGLLAATSIRGAKAKSGTSFAVPFVTAAAALVLGTGVTAADTRAALTASARDLGAPGRDPIFGHGLLSLDTLCAETTDLLEQGGE